MILIPQLFFFRARTLEQIQALVLQKNLIDPPSTENQRVFNAPIKDGTQWVITYMEFQNVDIDPQSIQSSNDSEITNVE